MSPIEPLLTLDEVAQILKISRSTVDKHIRARRLKKSTLGGVVRVEPADLRAFIDSGKSKAPVEETVTTLRLEGDAAGSTAKAQVIKDTES